MLKYSLTSLKPDEPWIQPQLLRALSSLVSRSVRTELPPPYTKGNLLQCFSILLVKKVLPVLGQNLLSQFLTILSCPPIMNYCKEVGSIFSVVFHGYWKVVSSQTAFPRRTHPVLSAFPCALCSSPRLSWWHLACCSFSLPILYSKSSKLNVVFQVWSNKYWVRGSSHLPWSSVYVLLSKFNCLLAFAAVREHGWCVFRLLSTRIYNSFSEKLLIRWAVSSINNAESWFMPGRGPCLWSFCILWVLCLPNFVVNLGPSEALSYSLVCHLLHQSHFIHGFGEATKQKSSQDRPLRKSILSWISRRDHYPLPSWPREFFINLIRKWPRKWGFHLRYHKRWCKNDLLSQDNIIDNCLITYHLPILFIYFYCRR